MLSAERYGPSEQTWRWTSIQLAARREEYTTTYFWSKAVPSKILWCKNKENKYYGIQNMFVLEQSCLHIGIV